MSTTQVTTRKSPGRAPESLAARMVLRRLERIEQGQLVVEEGGRRHAFGVPAPDSLQATVEVLDARFFRALAGRGSVGAGEAWAKGWWTSPDPVSVVRLLVRNHGALLGLNHGLARLAQPVRKLYHAFKRNTQRGSRANIEAHYDLSNEFFGLFLDETMTYSCGLFEHENTTLQEASTAKIDALCRSLDLSPGDSLLEIGTGWGEFALHAAREYGARVTTTTISREQQRFAAKKFHRAGFEDRIDLRLQDYRQLEGTFDKLVSVEMIEAVGHQYFGAFFKRCGELLAPDGVMALQAITIADAHYERAKSSVDFIQRYIFPGCCIPSVTALSTAMARESDLRPFHLDDIGLHYVRTLSLWRKNLLQRWHEARALGYGDEFLRLFEFYFIYCEGGFAERHISDVQMLLAKPAYGGGSRPR